MNAMYRTEWATVTRLALAEAVGEEVGDGLALAALLIGLGDVVRRLVGDQGDGGEDDEEEGYDERFCSFLSCGMEGGGGGGSRG